MKDYQPKVSSVLAYPTMCWGVDVITKFLQEKGIDYLIIMEAISCEINGHSVSITNLYNYTAESLTWTINIDGKEYSAAGWEYIVNELKKLL